MEISNLQTLQQLQQLANLSGSNSPLGGGGNSSNVPALQDALKIVQGLLQQMMGQNGGTPGASGGTGGADLQKDSGALAGYMNQNGLKSLDANTLQKLATDDSGNTPPAVKQAARDMLADPDAYKAIETNDVAGADGKSGANNFEKAAQGLVPGVGGGAGGAGAGAGAGAVGGGSNAADGAAGSHGPFGGTGAADLQKDSGAIAGYMRQHGLKSLDANTLEKLATDKSGDTPATVRQAARDLLANPDAYKAIETEDVAGADGKSSVSNFEKAAQGLIPGASGGAGALNLAARIS
jgi:hypothetical protein